MRNSIGRLVSLLVPAFVLLGVLAHPGQAQEKKAQMSAVKEGTLKEIGQNEKVRVAEVTYKPGEGSPAAQRPMRVVHCMKGGTLERTYADGSKETAEWKPGDTKILTEQRPYAIKNVGKTEIRLLVVFLK